MGWPPEQIAGRLTLRQGKSVISYESIYRYIYWRVWSFNENLHLLLPRHKRRRGRQRRKESGRWAERIHRRVSIAKRPASVDTRSSSGHWEADTMAFSKQQQAVLVLFERRSRFTILQPQRDKSSAAAVSIMADVLKTFAPSKRRSVTMDNGPEFTKHYLLSDQLGLKTWFCDPRSPWQKGGVENTIGRLRRFLPRKIDPAKLTCSDFVRLTDQHNATPRKCIGFLTPQEVFLKRKPQRVALQT